ncbi:MAG: hypothetical protein FWH55_10380 [Oscillospiraceae bacterium]|nr:hypothetical protein [Oscillospiraceae bacterium]
MEQTALVHKRFIANRRSIIIIFIIVISAILEVTLFNLPYYYHFWQGEESSDYEVVSMELRPTGYYALPEENRADEDMPGPAFVFNDLNRRVNSIYIEPADDAPDRVIFDVSFGDEELIRKEGGWGATYEIVKGIDRTYYHVINPFGNVSYMKIMPRGSDFAVKSVAVNKVIPISFSLIRFIGVALLATGVFLLVVSDIRKVVFDANCKRQRRILVFVLIGFALLGLLLIRANKPPGVTSPYSAMVDALLDGRLDLGIQVPQELLDMDNPYDPIARGDANVPGFTFDNPYYNGKVYFYHGIIPVIALHLPYYLLFDSYLSNVNATIILTLLAGLFLVLLWRAIVNKHFKRMPFVLFICSAVALLGCSLIISHFYYPSQYVISAASSLMFIVLGLWLIYPRPNEDANEGEDEDAIAVTDVVESEAEGAASHAAGYTTGDEAEDKADYEAEDEADYKSRDEAEDETKDKEGYETDHGVDFEAKDKAGDETDYDADYDADYEAEDMACYEAEDDLSDRIKIRNPPYLRIALGCLSLALSVGCRPTAVFASFLVPVVLYPHFFKKDLKSILKMFTCVAVPYLLVAIPLMWYNYARFESIFEFGWSYQINARNEAKNTLANPISSLQLAWFGLKNTLFSQVNFLTSFPYIQNAGSYSFAEDMPWRYYPSHVGLINFPVFWSLFLIPAILRDVWKKNRYLFSICASMLILGLFTAVFNVVRVGMTVRYQTDYMFLFLFPSLACGYLAWERFGRNSAAIKVMCVLLLLGAAIAIPFGSGGGLMIWPLSPDSMTKLRMFFAPF